MLGVKLCTILFLLIVFVEDLKLRAVHWSMFPGLFLLLGVPAVLGQPKHDWYASMVFNLGFLLLQGGAALALVMLRRRSWFNPFSTLIGMGDVLFLGIAAIGLSTEHFLPFYLSGLALCLVGYGLLVWWVPSTERTVPTAGFLALYLAMWVAMEQVGVLSALHAGQFAHQLLTHG